MEAELIKWEKLNEMRFLSLQRRTELIRREYGIVVGTAVLAELYRRNGIRYLQAKRFTRVTDVHEVRLQQERIAFARKLKGLQDEGLGGQLIYMDETTFMIWPKPAKTW